VSTVRKVEEVVKNYTGSIVFCGDFIISLNWSGGQIGFEKIFNFTNCDHNKT